MTAGWWHDPAEFKTRLEQAGTLTRLSQQTGVPRTTLDSAKKRHQDAGLLDRVEVRDIPADRLNDIAGLLRERGMNPDEWVVDGCTVNEWGAGENLQRQLKVRVRRRFGPDLIRPAVDVKPLPPPRKPDKTRPRLVVFVGDEQEPHGDPVLKELFLRWLAENRPAEGVHLGDLLDLGPLSRHRPNRKWDRTVQEGVQAGYETLRHRREASPETEWVMLPCNHGADRLRDYQLARIPELYGVRPADIDEQVFHASLSLPALLHLDALGIRYLGGEDDYEHVQHDIVPRSLVARHGWITGQNSAEKTVRKLGCNVVVGHTHRQRHHVVTEERFGERLHMEVVEAGCMCSVKGGLGYVVNPDWQQGWATAVVWPDGSHILELATYRDGVVRWRDQRYSIGRNAA